MTVDTHECDVVVAGGSLAALRAAIAARDAGADVVLVSKGVAGRSGSTTVASHDLCGIVPGLEAGDSVDLFYQDVMNAGHWLNDPRLAAALAEDSGQRIVDLESYGIQLLSVDGRFDQVQPPGHSGPRGYRVASLPGIPPGVMVSLPMRQFAERIGVRCFDRYKVASLVVVDGHVCGAAAIDLSQRQPVLFRASAVVVATGGGATLYARTNGTRDVVGEGYGLALVAGAELRDMEFVQFHPTRMDSPMSRLVTEGLIEDGAVLRNRLGEEFMYRYHPDGSMAPRDYRCRGIMTEIQQGNGVDGYVLLDASGMPEERITLRHAPFAESLRKHGLDFPREPIKVSPAAHFFMGGIAIDPDGATTVAGLFACGEVAGGAHGANRLGSAAYSEALVFGARAGAGAAQFASTIRARPAPEQIPDLTESAGTATKAHWRELQHVMWEHAGLQRNAQGLEFALATIARLRNSTGVKTREPGLDFQNDSFGLALLAAESIIRSALIRQESRGAHWRTDFPDDGGPEWEGNVVVSQQDGAWRTEFRPNRVPMHESGS